MRCGECGRDNRDEARFCAGCGSPLEAPPVRKASARGWYAVAAFLSVAVVVLLVVALLPSKDNPSPNPFSDTGSLFERMAEANGGDLPELIYDKDGMLSFVRGCFTKRKVTTQEEALLAIEDILPMLNVADANEELTYERTNERDGITFYRFGQRYEGLDVEGRQLVLAVTKNGDVSALSGSTVAIEDLSTKPKIDEQKALDAVRADKGTAVLSEGLVVCAVDGTPHLAYKVSCENAVRYVDAADGKVILTCSSSHTGKGIDGVHEKGKEVDFNTEKTDRGTFELVDKQRNITYRDAKGETVKKKKTIASESGTALFVTDDDEGWKSLQENKPITKRELDAKLSVSDYCHLCYAYEDGLVLSEVASCCTEENESEVPIIEKSDNVWKDAYTLSVVSAINKSYDYYAKIGWKGYCGHNHPLQVYLRDNYRAVNGQLSPENAAFEERWHYITIGKDNDVDPELISHEYTHAVISDLCKLGESGITKAEANSLNEGYADIMSIVINADTSWSWWNGTRNLRDVNKSKEGDGHLSRYDPNAFPLEEHHGATLIGHAAYLMYKNGLSMDEIGKLWFNSQWYLTPTSGFRTCRGAVISAASAMGFSDSKMKVVQEAFDEVGIPASYATSPTAEVRVLNKDGSDHKGFDITLTNQTPSSGNKATIYSASTKGSTIPLSRVANEDEILENVYELTVSDSSNPKVRTTSFVTFYKHGVSRIDVNLGSEESPLEEKESASNVKEVLEKFAESLNVKRYETDYMCQMRGGKNDSWFRWLAKEYPVEGTAIGTKIVDFDDDGTLEFLVVRWQDDSVVLEMYAVEDGKAVLKDKMADYASAFPIKGVGALDVACDEKGGINVQWWNRNTPVADGRWWHLDRYTYDGGGFKLSGSASQDGTGIYELGNLKSQLSALGLPTRLIPDVDKNEQFTSTLLADTEKSLKTVARIMATMDEGAASSYEEREAVRKRGGSEWSEPKRLGTFIVTQKPEEWPTGKKVSSDSDNKTSPGSEQEVVWESPVQLAVAFVRAWYDDWSLDGTSKHDNEQSVQERCRAMVGESSELYRRLGGSGLGKAAYSDRTDAATCVVEEPTIVSEDGNTCRVSIRYASDAESNWSGTSYDWLVKNRVHEVSWDVTTDGTSKTVTAVELAKRGPYTLVGRMCLHDEDVNGERVTVASMMLDEPIHFLYEIKGTNEGDAREVLVSQSRLDDYDEWARYDGCRMTVECEGLRGAYHDASFFNVDALAEGYVKLIEAEEPPAPDSAPGAASVVRLDGCELAIPDAWVGKVVQGERYGDVTLEWNGFYMLFMRQCAPSEFPVFGPEEESYQLDNGASVSILRGDDYAVVAEVTYGSGKGLLLYFHAYSGESMNFFHRSEEECQEYLALQAAATGRSADEDPEQVAMAYLKACVANLRFEE